MSDFLRAMVELFQGYGPGMSGYVLAIAALAFTLFALGYGVRSYNRSLTSVVKMSEDLREAMRLEKAECERECRRLREINEQLQREKEELIRQHSFAREEFLQEARERELMHGRLLQQLEAMSTKAQALSVELDAIRAGTRQEPRNGT